MKAPKTVRRIAVAVPLAMLLVALQWAVAGAGTPIKTGLYKGKTTQQAVTDSFRAIQFKVKKGRVTITTEPSVAREDCISTPVFTQDGNNASKKLGRNRSFTLTHTFLGNKIDKIHGKFVAPNEIQGYALYHFSAQTLCSEGKSKVNFTASHK